MGAVKPMLYAMQNTEIEPHSRIMACRAIHALTEKDDDTLHHFEDKQAKVLAFACGAHARLGRNSRVCTLNDLVMTLIVREVLDDEVFRAVIDSGGVHAFTSVFNSETVMDGLCVWTVKILKNLTVDPSMLAVLRQREVLKTLNLKRAASIHCHAVRMQHALLMLFIVSYTVCLTCLCTRFLLYIY